ncbi:monooxygenase [Sporothrix schenckii 1099-18]|uniref:Monooxygenase n=1 Tax=Sporothrix schenckii 1099-18 TaxID=1397361 RepID=A0A0F2M4M1_SPOSC|nr:monooxygenase [Sporothrix schenckii 1099-18]KJR84034.1 monooxygenase [Sporothrix schenckii 1099-18]
MSLKIAIIGAGPAGCTLARLLHLGGIDATVYEGEASPNYRSQGGTLDLHTATGLAALKEAGLWDEFLKHARYDGEYMLVCDKNLNSFFSKGNEPTSETDLMGQRPEIDRSSLRQILSESLPSGMIQWGRHVKSITTATAATKASITFSDATTASGFDLIVGADGAWSKVRAALSDQKPLFSGMALNELHIPDAANTAPALTKLVHRGSIFVQADGRKAAIQQMGDGSLHVTVATRRSDTPNVPLLGGPDGTTRADNWTETCGYDPTSLDEVKAAMLSRPELIADFDPRLQDCVTYAAGDTVPRSLYALPVGFQWDHQPGLTLIGDAAHLMTPFAGEGVNVAMDDARKLAAAILGVASASSASNAVRHPAELDTAVHHFETEMYVRVQKVAKLTNDLLLAWFYTPGAPESVVASVMAAHVRFHMPALAAPFATAAIHAYYFLYKKCLKKEIKV